MTRLQARRRAASHRDRALQRRQAARLRRGRWPSPTCSAWCRGRARPRLPRARPAARPRLRRGRARRTEAHPACASCARRSASASTTFAALAAMQGLCRGRAGPARPRAGRLRPAPARASAAIGRSIRTPCSASTRSAAEREIKRAYRKLMSQHHPDKLGDVPEELKRRAEERAARSMRPTNGSRPSADSSSGYCRTSGRRRRARSLLGLADADLAAPRGESRRRKSSWNLDMARQSPVIAPSILSADFARLGEEVDSGARRRRRLGPLRRDGQPLRAEPDHRPAGLRGACASTASPRRSTCT